MKVLIDCDVIVDVATGRPPFVTDSKQVLDWCERHRGSGIVAWHTIANLYYILRKHHSDALARRFIHDLLDFLEVAATGTPQAKHALAMSLGDLEDALQVAAAAHTGADYIITRNMGHYRAAVISAILPVDFLAQAPF
jgi:predicted nucleic acid-binding protein